MQQLFDLVTYLAGNKETLTEIQSQKPLVPFAEETKGFLSLLSFFLRSDSAAKKMSDVMAFAFWCRKANLEQMEREYNGSIKQRLGCGVTLHFAPSNIPVLFAFTMAAGLLAGNCCVIRMPRKSTPQAERICAAIRAACTEEYPKFGKRIVLLRYGHEPEITAALSKLCDVRVIWGGDSSVTEIRKTPLPPRSVDLPFADRGSIAVLDAKAVLDMDSIDILARPFYDDTYLNDQNACSAPKIVFWIGTGNEVAAAQEKFWNAVYSYIKPRYEIAPVTAVEKLECALYMAAVIPNVKILMNENLITRIETPCLKAQMWEFTMPGGFFIESQGEYLNGILQVLTKYCQTICCYGVDRNKLIRLICDSRVRGGDRIVNLGHTLDFGLIWDGYDLIETMSRRIIEG